MNNIEFVKYLNLIFLRNVAESQLFSALNKCVQNYIWSRKFIRIKNIKVFKYQQTIFVKLSTNRKYVKF